jgi:multicomponent Na+:H+ antiporter subunit D
VNSLIPFPVVIPLLCAALLTALRPIIRKAIADTIAITAATANTVICVLLVGLSRHDTLVYWFGNWRPRGGIALGISFTVDPVGAGIATVCSLLTVAALVFSLKYFESVGSLYHVLMLVFLAAMCGFSLTGDAFNMFVFFELMSASAFALCGYKTEEVESLQGATNFGITNTIGAFLSLDGIALLYARTGALNLAQIGRTIGSTADGLIIVAFLFLISGFLIKAAVVPFHLWLADAHAVAPTPVCILFSGVMVELGLYAVARVYWTVFEPSFVSSAVALKATLITIGVMTALVGAVMCFAQNHLKRLLAFSTISHMGLLFIGFGLLSPEGFGSLSIYFLGHSLVKAALFVATGILLHRFQTVNELELRGQCRVSPLTAGIFVIGGLALAGMPPFATFFGAAGIDAAAKAAGYWWVPIVSAIVAIGTGGAVLRCAARIFFGWGRGASRRTRSSHDDVEKASPISHVMTAPAIVLLLIAAIIGVSHSFRDAALRYAIRLQDAQAYAGHVLDGIPRPAVMAQSHDVSAGAVLQALGVTLAAIILAWFSLIPYSRRAPRMLRLPINGLRALHTGVVGDYVMWIVVGVGALGLIFMRIL